MALKAIKWRALPLLLLPALGACAQTQGVPAAAPYGYAPYDQQENPFCGALGNCAPGNSAPYPMRGNYDG